MAKKNPTDVPELNPSAGGSYTRHPETGDLTQVEGPGIGEPQPATPAPADQPNTINQE